MAKFNDHLVNVFFGIRYQKLSTESSRLVLMSAGESIMLYNVPGRTGCNMLPETVKKLSEIDNIVALKEASGNITQIVS